MDGECTNAVCIHGLKQFQHQHALSIDACLPSLVMGGNKMNINTVP